MHHGATGKIERTFGEDEAGMTVGDVACLGSGVSIRAVPVPHHMRDRQVGKGEPQYAEDDHRRELETFCETAADQRDWDCSKGQLEHAVHEVRQVLAFTKRDRKSTRL